MTKTISISEILHKADDLMRDINSLCINLPENDLYAIKHRLMQSAENLPKNIEKLFLITNKVERLKQNIIINSCLNDCKEYLNFIQRMRFAYTDFLLVKLEELTKLLQGPSSIERGAVSRTFV